MYNITMSEEILKWIENHNTLISIISGIFIFLFSLYKYFHPKDKDKKIFKNNAIGNININNNNNNNNNITTGNNSNIKVINNNFENKKNNQVNNENNKKNSEYLGDLEIFEKYIDTEEWELINEYPATWASSKHRRWQIRQSDILDSNNSFKEPWVKFDDDEHNKKVQIKLYIEETLIQSYTFLLLDGANFTLPIPKIKILDCPSEQELCRLFYWDKDSIEFKIAKKVIKNIYYNFNKIKNRTGVVVTNKNTLPENIDGVWKYYYEKGSWKYDTINKKEKKF